MSKPGPAPITIIDLAKRLKLSPGAVSQALNGTPSTIRVSPKTALRVRKMADKLNYRPNRMARILRTGRSGMVGILTHQGFSELTPVHLYHARVNAERVGLIPFIYEISSSLPDAERLAVQFILDVKVDALLVLGWEEKNVGLIKNAGIPVAVVGKLDSRAVPSYFVDQVGGYRTAAQHLIDLGHDRICLVTDQDKTIYHIAGIQGVESAVNAAKKRGRPASWTLQPVKPRFDGFMVRSVPHIHGVYAAGYLGMKAIIAKGDLPDAIVFRGDSWAQGGLRACKEAGIRVPEDIAISGFGDVPSSSAGLMSLTSVVQPLDALQEAVFNDIRLALDGGSIPSDHYVEFPCSLVGRDSSGTARSVKH